VKMLKITLRSILVLTSLAAISACTANPSGTTQNSPEAGSNLKNVLTTDYENALPAITQLALGTFKLEESSAPLTATQAGELLPLWKGYSSLSSSGSASALELEGLVRQIQRAYSPEQLETIAAQELTMEDLAQLAQEKDITLGGPGRGSNANLTKEQQATREALRQAAQSGGGGGGGGGGFFPGGGPPPEMGGGMGPGGGGFGSGFAATPGAVETARAGGMRPGGMIPGGVTPGLLQALIGYLQTMAGG
jgi:hypothetical protein